MDSHQNLMCVSHKPFRMYMIKIQTYKARKRKKANQKCKKGKTKVEKKEKDTKKA